MVPGLPQVDVDDLLDFAEGVDDDGDPQWSTGSVRAAARQGCLRMAAAAAVEFDFVTDGSGFQRSQKSAAWLRLAREYGSGVSGTLQLHTEQV